MAADVLQRADWVFKEQNVIPALELLVPIEGDFLLTSNQGADLRGRVDSAIVRYHLDVKGRCSMNDPVDDIIRNHASITAHLDEKDENL